MRNSIYKPLNYISDNITAQVNLYEKFKDIKLKKFIYASSSSIYGLSKLKNFPKKRNFRSFVFLFCNKTINRANFKIL